MIPTTVSGLFLILLSLLPGFVFVAQRNRHRPSKKLSAFRETTTVLVASASSYSPILAGVLIIAAVVPPFRRTVASFVAHPDTFRELHPLGLVMFVGATVAVSAGMAALAGRRGPWSSRSIDPGASAWWQIFSDDGGHAKGATRQLFVFMKDGSAVVGRLKSFSREADEHGDRDLVLQEPLFYQSPTGSQLHPMAGTAVIVSAREIQLIEVTFVVNDSDSENSVEATDTDAVSGEIDA